MRDHLKVLPLVLLVGVFSEVAWATCPVELEQSIQDLPWTSEENFAAEFSLNQVLDLAKTARSEGNFADVKRILEEGLLASTSKTASFELLLDRAEGEMSDDTASALSYATCALQLVEELPESEPERYKMRSEAWRVLSIARRFSGNFETSLEATNAARADYERFAEMTSPDDYADAILTLDLNATGVELELERHESVVERLKPYVDGNVSNISPEKLYLVSGRLAMSEQALGNLGDARRYSEQIYELYAEVPRHPNRMYTLMTAADVMAELGDVVWHDRIVNLMQSEISDFGDVSGMIRVHTDTKSLQGHILAGRADEALEMFWPTFQDYENVYSAQRAKAFAIQEANLESELQEQKIALLNTRAELAETRIKDERLVFGIAILSALLLALLGYLFLAKQSEKRRMKTRLDERTRLARELHDTLVQDFTATTLQMQRAKNKLEDPNSTAHVILTEALSDTDKALSRARRAIFETRLSPEKSVVDIVENGIAKVSEIRSIDILTDISPAKYPKLNVSQARDLSAILNEALINAAQHAAADEIRVNLTRKSKQTVLSIIDDGKGFEVNQLPTDHFGIIGLRERADSMDAKLLIESKIGKGTSIKLSF